MSDPGANDHAPLDYTVLPESFDALTASDDDLRGLGLPPVLATESNQRAVAFRRAFLLPAPGELPLRLLSAPKLPPTLPSIRAFPSAAIASRPAQKSLNWSGGYLAPREGRSFVSVMGRWKVPSVSPPPGGAAQEYRSSTWIGLDGQKFYLDSSLPQIGTSQRWMPGPPGEARYAAWFQWWARGQEATEIERPLDLPVAAGDEISAIITVLDETTVCCNLKNVTQGIILKAFEAIAPVPCHISGATVEWVMERPSPLSSVGSDPYRLPVYTPFAFSDCLAESIAPGNDALRDHDLERARTMRMYEITANPTSVRTISVANRVRKPIQKIELTYTGP